MALESIAEAIQNNLNGILDENKKDLAEAKNNQLTSAMIDRLSLTENSVLSLAKMCREIADQEQVVGTIVEQYGRPNGLIIQKQRIPIGVIGMIFESRPNVIVDGAALAIKSGNAIILKGGKEAQNTNRKLFDIISHAIERILPPGSVSLIETREDVSEMLKLHNLIDLMVPRGGSALVDYVKKNATMPVVAHDKGLCHLYVHQDAETQIVIPIILNAKTQRPGVCNALESLLLHENYPENKKILGIFARTKRKYNSESECIKDLKPVKLYLVEKFQKNGNLTVSHDSSLSFDISTRYKEKSEYIASLILNCNVKDDFDNSRFAKDLQYMFKDFQNVGDYFGIKLDIDVDYIKDSRGWIGLIDSDYIVQINSQFSSIKEKNENKDLEKEIKSKRMKNL